MTAERESGDVQMILGIEDGKVFQRFDRAVDVVRYDPQNCIEVAMHLTDLSFELRDGVKPVGMAGETLKAELVDRHRMTLTQRLALMLGSLREDKTRSNGQVAQELVDACLKEIF